MKIIIQDNSQRLFAILALVALFMVIQLSTPQLINTASAASCPGGVVCVSTTAAAVAGGNSSGSGLGNPGNVGGGGVMLPPSVPKIQSESGKWWDAYIQTTSFSPGSGGCPAISIRGIKVQAVGTTTTYRSKYKPTSDGGTDIQRYYFRTIYKQTCIYPSVDSNIDTQTCYVSYNARIDRLSQSWLGASNGVGRTNGTITSVGALEAEGGKSNCTKTASVDFAYNPPSGQNGWGQYKATSNIQQVNCDFLTTTFDGRQKTTGKCRPAGDVAGSVGKITVWCDGYSNSWLIKDWTGSDCKNSSRYPLVCSIPNAATYNGYAGNVQGIRDGKDSLVKWGTPRVVGGWGMTNWRSSTVVNAGSTPRNTAVNDNDKTQQLFSSSLNFSSGMTAGQNLDQQIGFYSAGDAGSPFSMTRNYLYDTWFTASHTEFRSLNLKNGSIGTASYSESAFAKNNKCGPQTSPRIDVVRAIGDTVQ